MANTEQDSKYKAALFGARGIIRILLVVLLIVMIAWLGRTAYTFGYAIFNEQAVDKAPGTDVTVEIPKDASAGQIGKILKKAGLIADVNIFVAQERLSAYHGKLKDGTFVLNTSETATQMMAILAGDTKTDSGSAASSTAANKGGSSLVGTNDVSGKTASS